MTRKESWLSTSQAKQFFNICLLVWAVKRGEDVNTENGCTIGLPPLLALADRYPHRLDVNFPENTLHLASTHSSSPLTFRLFVGYLGAPYATEGVWQGGRKGMEDVGATGSVGCFVKSIQRYEGIRESWQEELFRYMVVDYRHKEEEMGWKNI